MKLLAELKAEADARGLKFLVIGGLAVSAHGYSRQTADIDLLVRKTDREVWEEMLRVRNFSRKSSVEVFSQWQPPGSSGDWPVDFMFVNDETFSKMWTQGREFVIEGVRLNTPSLGHLLALKLHALRHAHAGRQMKDMIDVVYLIDVNKVDVRGPEFKELCLKHGTAEIYERLVGKGG